MGYTKTVWQDDVTPLSAENMNKLETQYDRVMADAPTGLQGKPGPQGLPGVNAVDNDTAVAGYLGTAGASASKTALLGVGDGRYGRKQGAIEFSDDYSMMPDGAPQASLTGQSYSLHSATKPNGIPVISNGFLTYGDSDYLGGYATVNLERSVVRFGASFAFTPYTAGGGLACVAAMSQDIAQTAAAGQGVPASPFHLTIAPDAWGVDVFQTTGSGPTSIAGGVFSPPLAADAQTLHRVEVVLDRVNQVAYLTLPNGERKTISNPYMGTAAQYVFVEPYRDTNASGKTKALFRSFWADSRNDSPISQAKANARRTSAVVAVENMPGAQSDITITTTPTKVPGVSVNYVVPDSGAVIVTLEGLLDATAAGPVYFGIMDEGNNLTAVRTVATKPTNGRMSLRLPVSTGSAGQTKTASMCVYLGGSAAAKLLLGNYGSPNVYAGASIQVTNA